MTYRDVIFKGATRPAMMAGVPILPFILVVGLHILFGMWGMIFFGGMVPVAIGLSCIICIVVMRTISAQDDQRLLQYLLVLRGFPSKRNQLHWGAKSLSAIRYAKRADRSEKSQ